MQRNHRWRGTKSGTLPGKIRGLLGIALLALSACEGDPAAYGITGPFPEGVAPVTLTRALPRLETSDDTPGVRVDAADRYAATARQRATASATATRRYYGYDH